MGRSITTNVGFKKATKQNVKARIALVGPSGAGKTWTALSEARALVGPSGRIAVVDTENASASRYSDRFDFDVLNLDEFDPRNYIQAIDEAVKSGYDVIILDSLSHAWEGTGGVLDQHGRAADRTKNTWSAWREVTPLHKQLVDTIIQCPIHVIACMRVKTEWETTKNDRGQLEVVKLGLAPIQRAGVEYEFDLVVDLDHRHTATVSKTRFSALDGKRYMAPSGEIGTAIREWLADVPQSPQRPLERAQSDVQEKPIPTPTPENTTLTEPPSGGWRDRIVEAEEQGFAAVAALREEIQAIEPAKRRANVLPYYWLAIASTSFDAIAACETMDDFNNIAGYLSGMPETVTISGTENELNRQAIWAAGAQKRNELSGELE